MSYRIKVCVFNFEKVSPVVIGDNGFFQGSYQSVVDRYQNLSRELKA